MGVPTKTYDYRGRNGAGKVVKGRMDAVSESVAIARMRNLGLSPVALTEVGHATGLQREITLPGMQKGVSLKDLAVMNRQLATMVSAGLSLLRALTILSEQTENRTLAKALDTVRAEVEGGSALSAAVGRHPKIFPPLMIHLVRAGETGGFLESALESVAANYESEVRLRNTIKSALTYPLVVLIMAILAVIGMLIFIVPVFKQMFADFGSELPLPTQALVVLSEAMVWIAPILLIGGIAFAFWWRSNKHTERVRRVVDPLKLRLPVFGELFKKVAVARFSRNFSTMMGSGVPILQSLSVVGETSGNIVLEDALRRVQDSVRTGKSIAGPLAQAPIFPAMVTQMVAVGEDSGALEEMLAKIADFYDEEVKSVTEQLTALIEPLMIAFIGLVIGGMIVALYMPIFSIFNEIQ